MSLRPRLMLPALVTILAIGLGHAHAGSRSERELARLTERTITIEVQDSVTGGCLPSPTALSDTTRSTLTNNGLKVADSVDITQGDYLYSIHAIGGSSGEACSVTLHIEVARVAQLVESDGGFQTIVLAISAVVPFLTAKSASQSSAERAATQVAQAVAESAVELQQKVAADGG